MAGSRGHPHGFQGPAMALLRVFVSLGVTVAGGLTKGAPKGECRPARPLALPA
jgi:hypothetical protein